MRYKKHMIILLAAIFLFAMATASAADSNDTAVAVEDGQLTDEIIQASENQENTIQASNNDELNLSEDDLGKLAIANDKKLGKTVTRHTFNDINKAIESDCTIYLEPGTYTGDHDISIRQKSNIKIIGNSTILDAQSQTQIFNIQRSSNITIQNIIFKNGYTGGVAGGAIEVFDSCCDCIISNCTFINNHANRGGAIDWDFQCVNGRVSNCTFINNTAGQDGGAIRWDESNDGRVNNCTFINNTAEGDGDAIDASSCDLNADYNWFGNTADNYNDPLPITWHVKCDYRLFLKATANPDTITRKDTSNVTFKLYQYGSGGISDYDNAPFKNLDLTITATKGNVGGTAKLGEPIQFTPTGKGTASVTATVEDVRQTAEINVLKGDFDLLQDLVNNESLSVINLERNYTYNEFDTITDGVRITRPITINGNGFTIDAKGKSRIFNVTAGTINITDVTLKNGKAVNGGAIYFENAISNSNINATYINNTAKNSGGANYFRNSVSDSNITGIYAYNTATSNGGANYFRNSVSDSNITGTYTNNTAKGYGGANFFTGSVSGSNISGTYINNTAERGGGANNFDSVSTSNISGTYINNNATYGGANYFWGSVLGSNVSGTFINNTAEWDGGANYFDSVSTSNISGTYINNTAEQNGGANRFGSVLGSNVSGTFINNTAEWDGGANYFRGSVLGSNVSGTYANNTAKNKGGANFLWHKVSGSNVGGIYINNTALNAVIYFEDYFYRGLDANITNAIFLNNNCTYEIYTITRGIVVKDSWFGNNASNYMNKPNINDNVQMDGWLFLNGTNDHNNIKFFLMGYDGTTVSEYDNILMPKINLTIATTDGILDKSTVDLDEPVKFSPTEIGINRVTAQIEDATQTIEFTNGDFDVLQTIVNNATSSVINLTRNYTYNEFDTITEGVRINRPITVNGNGFTIDAKGKSRIFYVTAGSINITNVTLKNGKADSGGAIYFENEISNSNINANYINNTAAKWGGGANYFRGSVSGSNVSGTYINNTAEYYGGANFFVSVSGSNISGTYANNKATITNGGANDFGSVSGSNVSGTYINNTAKQNGGANYFWNSVSGSNIAGTYTNNTAEYGGANYFDDKVSGSNVSGIYINNTASNAVIHFEDYFNRGLDANITNAIFLNNNCTYEIYARIPSDIRVKDSWFGNNASNYMNKPNINDNVTVDNWLFLNATVNPSSLLILDSSKVTFKLYSTDGIKVSDFDNSKLPVVNLTLTAINGEVSNSTVLDKSVEYMPTKGGQGSVTASVEDAEYTIFLDNNKRDVNLSVAVDPPVIDYGENAAVIFEYNVTATGTVNITLKGKKHNQTIENVALNKTITLPDTILPDEYEVTVSYSGDDVFVNASAASSLTVNQLKSDIKVVGYDIYVNDTNGLMFSVTLPENATGNLTISNGIILNVTKEGRKENSSLIIEIKNDAYSVGQYNWTFTYSDDDIYENSQAKSTANILIIPTEITANATSSLFVDDTGQVTYNVTPENAVGNVKFTSNDTSVVEVDQNGNIKAIAEGTAIITVTFEGCENYTASSTNVTVTVSKIATEITLTNETVELKAYKSTGDLAKLDPAGAGNLTYASSDEDIVMVSEDGIIYARIKGTATVTVSFAGDNKYKAAESKNITVTVTLNDASVSTENDTIDLYVDDACIINATANPSFLTVYYASSNESVATVTDYGNVKAVGEGTAVITLTIGNGETYTINSTNVTVTVSKVPTEISIENDTLKLEVTDEVDTGTTLTPADAGNVTYTISNSSVVKVKGGKVIALAEGEAAITVSFVGDVKYAVAKNKTITVTVSLKDASVSVNNDTLDLFVDDTFNLVATTEPKDLTVNFTSSNPSIVTVDNKGNVVAIGEGIANITVSVGGDGVYTENLTIVAVSVSKIPTEIIVQNATVDMKVGDEFNPVVSIMPSNAGNMSFKSSDVDVVLVNGHGYILAVGEGNATVTVAFDGNKKYAAASKNITVSVSKIPTEIILTNETLDLEVYDVFEGLANLTPADAGNLTFISSDEDIVFVAENIILAYGKGNATVTVSFAGNDNYAAAENKTITVNVSLKDASVSVENTTLELYVDDKYDLNATTIPHWLNVEYASSDESVATVTDYGIVTAIGEGTAIITVVVGDDEIYAKNSTTVTVTVKKQDANINVSIPENITVGDNSTVNVVLPEYATGNVTVIVDGEVADTVAVTDGTAEVTIPSMSAGNHTVEIAYSGDDKYKSASKTATLTVNKDSTNITAADVTATYKVNKYLVVKLTDSKGNPLANATVTVELTTAKNYTSDENGQVKVKVSSLVPKTYTAKITFKGDDKYAESNTTAKVTVKKATAKITAKAKTFKTTTKTKKYTVTLKANGKALKNKWVYLKVSGKTYKAKTNSKGKATFKITKLNKAGKFKATVTFKGNDYYKKTTKKVTIKVKSVWKTVQKGSKNSAIVKKIQRALKNHGYYLEYKGHYLKVDGIFWDYTKMAVKEFQNDKTLKVTGKVDEKTAKKLGII